MWVQLKLNDLRTLKTRNDFSPCFNRLSLSRFRLTCTSSLNISEQATFRCQNCLISNPTISMKERCNFGTV